MTIRTVTISDITAVDFDPDKENPYFYLSEKYIWVRNKSSAEIYVSAKEEPSPGDYGTLEILSGACALFGMPENNIIYFSGDGDAEIYTSNVAACPFEGGSSGGGSGGTTNYNALNNKPKINGVTLSGDKTLKELGIDTLTAEQMSALKRLIK